MAPHAHCVLRALLFKDRRSTAMVALVCQNCGCTELYAAEPRALTP